MGAQPRSGQTEGRACAARFRVPAEVMMAETAGESALRMLDGGQSLRFVRAKASMHTLSRSARPTQGCR
jgi:hypothetical protein